MAEFYKEKNMVFQLVNLEKLESFVIWPKWGLNPENDEELKNYDFPIKSGELMGKDSKVRSVDELKYFKKAEFDIQYPKLQKQTRYIRQIIVGGEPYAYSFTIISDNELEKMLQLLKSTGKDPLTCTFKQTYHEEETPAKKYTVTFEEDLKETNQGSSKELFSSTGTIKPGKDVALSEMSFSEYETAIMEKLKGLTVKKNKEEFYQIYKQNFEEWKQPITEERLNSLWEHYNK